MSSLVVLLSDGVGCKLWHRLSGITVTSAPVSNLNSASSPFLYLLGQHIVQWVHLGRTLLLLSVSQENSLHPLLSDWDLQAFAQCSTLGHLVHFDSLAGHSLFGCGWPRHFLHCASGVFPVLDFGGFFFFFVSSLESFPFPLDKRSTWAGGGSDLVSCRNVCCFLTVSDCLVFVIAFSKVSLESSCSYSESFNSCRLSQPRFYREWDRLLVFHTRSIRQDNKNLLWNYPLTHHLVNFSGWTWLVQILRFSLPRNELQTCLSPRCTALPLQLSVRMTL